jgi:5-methyltetrahydrofolate--homocysteine methyltransferase
MDNAKSRYDFRKLELKRVLRKQQTPAEAKLWEALRNRKLNGMKWRRQANIDIFIADFLCVQHRLIVEVDGEIHDDQKERDCLRTKIIGDHNYKIIRFKNEEILQRLPDVLQRITALTSRPPLQRSGEEGA